MDGVLLPEEMFLLVIPRPIAPAAIGSANNNKEEAAKWCHVLSSRLFPVRKSGGT